MNHHTTALGGADHRHRLARASRSAATLAASCVLVAACASGSEPDAAPVSDPTSATTAANEPTETSTHPVLVPDSTTHLGSTWFSPPEPSAAAVIDERRAAAQAASSVGRVMTDWIDIEPERGDYRIDDLDESLGDLADAGLAPMVTIAAVDISGTEFPAWLDGLEPEGAAAAYLSMIDAVAPVLRKHDVWLLAIANEPPLADGELDLDDFATFVSAVEAGAEALVPGLAVTFTFAGTDSFIDEPAIDAMIDAVDVFSVNHYCIENDLLRRPLAGETERIDRLIERAGDLPVVFQELGCPAGEANASSDADQLAWFDLAFDHLDSIEQVRAAFVFEFLDWSPSTFELSYGSVLDVLDAELGPAFVERFESWLLTSGLVRADGSTRPAFDRFLDAAAN